MAEPQSQRERVLGLTLRRRETLFTGILLAPEADCLPTIAQDRFQEQPHVPYNTVEVQQGSLSNQQLNAAGQSCRRFYA